MRAWAALSVARFLAPHSWRNLFRSFGPPRPGFPCTLCPPGIVVPVPPDGSAPVTGKPCTRSLTYEVSLWPEYTIISSSRKRSNLPTVGNLLSGSCCFAYALSSANCCFRLVQCCRRSLTCLMYFLLLVATSVRLRICLLVSLGGVTEEGNGNCAASLECWRGSVVEERSLSRPWAHSEPSLCVSHPSLSLHELVPKGSRTLQAFCCCLFPPGPVGLRPLAL